MRGFPKKKIGLFLWVADKKGLCIRGPCMRGPFRDCGRSLGSCQHFYGPVSWPPLYIGGVRFVAHYFWILGPGIGITAAAAVVANSRGIKYHQTGGSQLWAKFSTNLEKGFARISKKQYWQAETMVKFCENFGEGLRGFPKRNLGGRKLWGNFCRNLERVCVDFQKAKLAGGNYGGIFSRNLEKWFARISKMQYWREETMGDFSRNLEKGLRGFPTSNVGGRKLWGNCSRNLGRVCVKFQKANLEAILQEEVLGEFSRNLGRVCVDFQKAMLAGGNYGGIFLEIGRNCLRGLPKSNVGGRKLWGICFRNLDKLFAWISKKQCWREETMGEFF